MLQSITTDLGTQDITLTKPSGLSVGDVMIAVVVSSRSSDSYTPPSGWSSITPVFSGQTNGQAFSKVADASDVATADFTFEAENLVNPSTSGGALYRFLGTEVDIANISVDGQDSTSTAAATISFPNVETIISDETFVIIVGGWDYNSGGSGNIGNYFVTGGTTPTFTERTAINNTGDDEMISFADGLYESESAITAYGYDIIGGANLTGTKRGNLILIPKTRSATGVLTKSTATTSVNNLTGTADTNGSVVKSTATATAKEIQGVGTNPTKWQTTPKS